MPLPKLTDREIVMLYREWSEWNYCADFIRLPKDGSLPQNFLEGTGRDEPWEPYEQDLINRWRKLETENP